MRLKLFERSRVYSWVDLNGYCTSHTAQAAYSYNGTILYLWSTRHNPHSYYSPIVPTRTADRPTVHLLLSGTASTYFRPVHFKSPRQTLKSKKLLHHLHIHDHHDVRVYGCITFLSFQPFSLSLLYTHASQMKSNIFAFFQQKKISFILLNTIFYYVEVKNWIIWCVCVWSRKKNVENISRKPEQNPSTRDWRRIIF